MPSSPARSASSGRRRQGHGRPQGRAARASSRSSRPGGRRSSSAWPSRRRPASMRPRSPPSTPAIARSTSTSSSCGEDWAARAAEHGLGRRRARRTPRTARTAGAARARPARARPRHARSRRTDREDDRILRSRPRHGLVGGARPGSVRRTGQNARRASRRRRRRRARRRGSAAGPARSLLHHRADRRRASALALVERGLAAGAPAVPAEALEPRNAVALARPAGDAPKPSPPAPTASSASSGLRAPEDDRNSYGCGRVPRGHQPLRGDVAAGDRVFVRCSDTTKYPAAPARIDTASVTVRTVPCDGSGRSTRS